MKILLSILLDELFKELEKTDSPVASLLQSGLSEVQIEEGLRAKGITLLLPKDVFDLYAWKNGLKHEIIDAKSIGAIRLFGLGIFPSFDDAIESYYYYAIKNKYWDCNLFPLFESGGGDFYLIDCSQDSPTYKMILFFSLVDPIVSNGVKTKFDSLLALIQSMLECYQKKIYWYNNSGGGFLEMNYELQLEVFIKNNPRSDYWKAVFQ